LTAYGQDLLHVRRKTIQVRDEAVAQALTTRYAKQFGQRGWCRVEKGLSSSTAQRALLVGNLGRVQVLLHRQHVLLGLLQQRIQSAQHDEGQDDIAVLAADVDCAGSLFCVLPLMRQCDDPASRSQLLIHDGLQGAHFRGTQSLVSISGCDGLSGFCDRSC
jgi:hypothetical protein